MYRLVLLMLFVLSSTTAQFLAPIAERLESKLQNISKDDKIKIWIYFNDKGSVEKHIPNTIVSEKAIARRSKVLPQNKLVDASDLPVFKNYIDAVAENISQIRYSSKWFNAVSGFATKAEIESIRQFPFIKEIDIVSNYGKKKSEPVEEVFETPLLKTLTDSLNYGTARKQVDQINVIPLHNRGIRGEGVLVGVFDNGFRLMSHESFSTMNIVAGYDFVDNDPNPAPPSTAPSSYGAHGVNTLSTIGGYKAGQIVGPAFKASYILGRTENDASETPVEEDNWVRAIEWAESLGVDIASTSLGYLTYDSPYASWTWQNMNGNTAVITRAADLAVNRGVVVLNSAGNEASVGTPNTLIAPADGFAVIAVGAVDSFGVRSSFSSYGPSFDGRIKPEVMAMGTGVKVASSTLTTGYSRVNGTSFSCPLSAGVAALILSAHPSLTPMQVREAMMRTASRAKNPDNYYGYGILNATAAADFYRPNLYHTPITGMQLNSPITILATVNSVIALNLDSCKVVYGVNGSFTNYVNLLPTSNPNEYTANIPALGTGNTVNYFITIQNIDKDFAKSPINSPAEYYSYNIGETTISQQLSTGWNLVSVALQLADYQSSTIFTSSASQVYGYQNGYVTKATLQNGKGYWVKYDSDHSIELSGYIRNVDTVNVTQGWNLIGGISSPVAVSSIIEEPASIISSSLYSYNNNLYEAATTIEPGKGYWVKVSANGKLILNSGGKK
ncbi:MAG: S8 family serine peptidase [Bacteroidota bacterium]|nr:S8 family serine peptidase [Bacteroidota bacterium]